MSRELGKSIADVCAASACAERVSASRKGARVRVRKTGVVIVPNRVGMCRGLRVGEMSNACSARVFQARIARGRGEESDICVERHVEWG